MSLTSDLYQSVSAQHKPRMIEHWHCSSIAKCPAALYLERKGVLPTPEAKPGAGKILRWAAGHAIEQVIRPHLESIYPDMVSNIRFTNEELDLSGEFDAYDPESKTLISVKSVHDFAMTTVGGKTGLKQDSGKKTPRGNVAWVLKDSPYAHHEWQEHAYVLLMSHPDTWTPVQENRNLAVEQIVYVYITLGGLIDTYTTPVKPEILKRVADKVKYLNDCYKADKVPICMCSEGQEMWKETNQYCDFRDSGECCDPNLLNEEKKK